MQKIHINVSHNFIFPLTLFSLECKTSYFLKNPHGTVNPQLTKITIDRHASFVEIYALPNGN